MNSYKLFVSHNILSSGRKPSPYLSDIGTYLANGSQELNGGHPFALAQSRLSSEVVHMLNKPF